MNVKGIVKNVQREAKVFKGVMQRGINIDNIWYDVEFNDSAIDYDALFENVYKRGYLVEIELKADGKSVISGKVLEARAPEAFSSGTNKKKKDMISYHDMLIMLIEKFPSYNMTVKDVRILPNTPMPDGKGNEVSVTLAVVTVSIDVITKEGHAIRAEATGDASMVNCNKDIAQHMIRLSETRAYARAMRSILGEDVVEEELN